MFVLERPRLLLRNTSSISIPVDLAAQKVVGFRRCPYRSLTGTSVGGRLRLTLKDTFPESCYCGLAHGFVCRRFFIEKVFCHAGAHLLVLQHLPIPKAGSTSPIARVWLSYDPPHRSRLLGSSRSELVCSVLTLSSSGSNTVRDCLLGSTALSSPGSG